MKKFRSLVTGLTVGITMASLMLSTDVSAATSVDDRVAQQVIQSLSMDEPGDYIKYRFFRIRDGEKLSFRLASKKEVYLCEKNEFRRGDIIIAINHMTALLFDQIEQKRERNAWEDAKNGPITFKGIQMIPREEIEELGLMPVLTFNPSVTFYRVVEHTILETAEQAVQSAKTEI